jgi:hypothetical protein
VVVLPFEDHRLRSGGGSAIFAFIPIVPCATSTYDRPEQWRRYTFRPLTEVPRLAVTLLREARIFSDVRYAPDGEAVPPDTDLVLEGAIRSSRLERQVFTYGLSFGASALWMVGFPMRRFEWGIGGYLRIIDASTGEVLWDHEFEEEIAYYQGVFYGRYAPPFRSLAQRGLRDAIHDLDRSVTGSRRGHEGGEG